MNKKMARLYYRLTLLVLYKWLCQKNEEVETNLKKNGWIDLDIPLLERTIWAHFNLQQVGSKK